MLQSIKMKTLLVEDDIPLSTTIANYLQSLGYEVVISYDGEEALEYIDKASFDIFIIDLNIPNIDGLELVRYIRNHNTHSPIIIITASLEVANFIQAFELGCSEYIKKPFFLEELEIRITKLLRLSPNILKINNKVSFDLKHQELIIDNTIVHLRKKERRLLTILIQNLNHTVPTQTIEEYVWENEIKESYPLRQLVSDLRKKLQNSDIRIVTDAKIGYRLETLS